MQPNKNSIPPHAADYFLLLCAKSERAQEEEVNQHLQNQYLHKCGGSGARQSFNNFSKLSETEK
jgi:hypothetical protein